MRTRQAGIVAQLRGKEMTNQQQTNTVASYRIDRIERSTTQAGAPIFEFYSEPLKHSVLTLFESDFGMLLSVDIDPNAITGKHYTCFIAHFVEGEKLNQNGNPYKNITHLEACDGSNQMLADILLELKAIKALILAGSSIEGEPEPAREVVPEAPPQRRDRSAITTAPAAPADEAMFDYVYGDGTTASPNHHTLFNAYRRAHNEQPPQDFEAARVWFNSK
jgi:hypothetical protein